MKNAFQIAVAMSVTSIVVVGLLKFSFRQLFDFEGLRQIGLILYMLSSYLPVLVGVFFGYRFAKKGIGLTGTQILSICVIYFPIHMLLLILANTVPRLIQGIDAFVSSLKFAFVMLGLSIFMERGDAAYFFDIILNISQLIFSTVFPIMLGFIITYLVVRRRSNSTNEIVRY